MSRLSNGVEKAQSVKRSEGDASKSLSRKNQSARVIRRPKQAAVFLTTLHLRAGGRSFFAKAKDHIVAGRNAIRVTGIELQGAAYYPSPEELLGRDALVGLHQMMRRKKCLSHTSLSHKLTIHSLASDGDVRELNSADGRKMGISLQA